MATKEIKALSPPGQCMEVFNAGGELRLLTAAPQHRLQQAAHTQDKKMMHLAAVAAAALIAAARESDLLTLLEAEAEADEDLQDALSKLHPLLKR